jgi:hypothetical protein
LYWLAAVGLMARVDAGGMKLPGGTTDADVTLACGNARAVRLSHEAPRA